MENKSFKSGEVIFNEGDPGKGMYDILSGQVGIYADYGKEDEKLLTALGSGKFFGELGLIDVMPRSATAVALEDTEAAYISEADFGGYYQKQPEKILMVLKNMTGRLRELSDDYLEACRTISEYLDLEAEKAAKESPLMRRIRKLIAISEKIASFEI